jgi:hypothetical protein
MADAGIGIADVLLVIGPSVCACCQQCAAHMLSHHTSLTSRGRRTENMPPSCDMAGANVLLQGYEVQYVRPQRGSSRFSKKYVVVDAGLVCPSAQ